MKKPTWLEYSEYVALAGSGLGTIATVLYSNIIYVAAPLTLTVSLSILNRQRFQQKTQVETQQEITNVQAIVEQKINALPTPPPPANLTPLEFKVTNLTHQIQDLNQQFQNRPEKAGLIQLSQHLNTLNQKLQDRPDRNEFLQVSGRLNMLTQQFNQRPETQVILQITEEFKTLAQQFHDRPEAQAIIQIKQRLELLTQRFNDRLEPQQIEQVREELQVLTHHFIQRPEPKEIANLKQEIETLTQEFKQRSEPEQIAQAQQQLHKFKQELAQVKSQFNKQVETQNIEVLQKINTLAEKFNNRPDKNALAKIKETLDIVTQQVNSFALTEPIDLSELKAEVTNYSNQLHNVRKQLEILNQQFYNRPEKQALYRIEENLDIVTKQVNSIVFTKPVDLTEIKMAIARYNVQLHNVRKQINILSQEFDSRPEKQVITRLDRTFNPQVEDSVRQWS